MQIWHSTPPVPPLEDGRQAVELARTTAWRDLARLAGSGVRVTRVRRLVIVRGPGLAIQDALTAYVAATPSLVLVLPDAQTLLILRRLLPVDMAAALDGRLFTAEQFARGQHRAMPYTGLVVSDWDALDERQRVALEGDIRPLVAIGWRS